MIFNNFGRTFKITVAVAGCLLLVACGMHYSMDDRMEKMFGMVAYKLDFTEEQRAILDEIQLTVKQVREQSMPQRKKRHEEMLSIFNAEELDVARLQEMMQERRESMSQMMPTVMPLAKQLHGTLTEEQKEKAVKIVSRRFKHLDQSET